MKDIFTYRDSFSQFRGIPSVLCKGNPADCPDSQVAVVIPAYNRPDTLEIAISSALNQDYTGCYEIIVVDNNQDEVSPNQAVVEALDAPNVLYYRNAENLGMYGNWNRGIELVRAPYFTYCHDDDQLLPGALSRLMALQARYGSRMILSAYNVMDENGTITSLYARYNKHRLFREKKDYRYRMFDIFLTSGGFGVGCLFNKEHMLSLGGYDKEYYPSADYALQTAYTMRFGAVYNSVPTFNYRVAVNESSTAYTLFAERDVFFRECMKPYLHLPEKWIDRIIEAAYHIFEVEFAISWGGKDVSLRESVSREDRKIWKRANDLASLRRITLNL